MSESTTNPSDLSSLDDASLQTLIDYYVKIVDKMPLGLRVRDRLIELQNELLSRQPKRCDQCGLELRLREREGYRCDMCTSFSTIEGVIRQTTDNPINK